MQTGIINMIQSTKLLHKKGYYLVLLRFVQLDIRQQIQFELL